MILDLRYQFKSQNGLYVSIKRAKAIPKADNYGAKLLNLLSLKQSHEMKTFIKVAGQFSSSGLSGKGHVGVCGYVPGAEDQESVEQGSLRTSLWIRTGGRGTVQSSHV